MRSPSILLVAVALIGCGEPNAPTPAPEAVVAPEPASIAPALPPARGDVDPSLRFAGDGSIDHAPLSRPTPWLAEAPQVDALVPSTPATALTESWRLVDVGGEDLVEHRVYGIFRVDPAQELARIEAQLDRMHATPRTDIAPTYTLEASSEPGPSGVWPISAWANDELGMPFQVIAEPHGPSALQISIATLASRDREPTLAAFARAVPRFSEIEARMRGLGPLSAASYARRVDRAPVSEWTIKRERTPEEERALDASDQDEGAAFYRASERAERRWESRAVAAMRGLAREDHEDFPLWRRGDVQAFLLTSECTFVLGETR